MVPGMSAPARTPPAGVLLDMDGLLLDSERVGMATFAHVAEQLGVSVAAEQYIQTIGLDRRGALQVLTDVLGTARAAAAFQQAWAEEYRRRTTVEAVPLRPGVPALLTRIAERGLPVAVATSTGTDAAERKLHLAGIREWFAHVVGGDQVEAGKPAPDIYLLGARRLGIDAAEGWAVEDSTNGVRAALAAGLTTFQVPDLVPVTDAVRELGHAIVASLEEVAALL